MSRLPDDMKRSLEAQDKEDALLFEKAQKGDASILSDPRVSEAFELEGERTPLHYLAATGCLEVLQHPRVGNCYDNDFGRTPLHYLAETGCLAVLKHPRATTEDELGLSPIDILDELGLLPPDYKKPKEQEIGS